MKTIFFSKSIFVSVVFLLISLLLFGCTPNIARLQSKGDIDKLVKALDYKHDNYIQEGEIRAEAIEALMEIGDPAVEKLLETYHNRKPQNRKNIELALREISNKVISEFAQEARGVCSGNGMAGAGSYIHVSPRPKPLMYVNKGEVYFENTIFKTLNYLPVDWLPFKRSDLQAIVCIRIDRTQLQGCSYSGGSSYRIRRSKTTVDVTVHEASTGTVIGSFTFDGSFQVVPQIRNC